jgi:hypothetical protein
MEFANLGFLPNPFSHIVDLEEDYVFENGKFEVEEVSASIL